MTQMVKINTRRPLTEFEARQVQTYAEFLIAKQESPSPTGIANNQDGQPHRVTYKGWAGALAGVEAEKSNKQFVQDAWDEMLSRADQ
jgi:hypothetical protein